MLEAAFYLSKYQQKSKYEKTQNYWIEIGGPPSKDYIGKFLWAPKAPQWELLEEIQKDDVVYHYVTSKGPMEYRGKFVGKSKAKGQAKEIDKDELARIMKEIDENWEEFFKDWRNYDTFYLVELYDYNEFKQPVPKDKVGFNPPHKYFIRAKPEIADKIERLTLTQRHVDITLNDFFKSRGYLFPSEVVSQFYTALKTKGFVILSGITGSGKTKIALEFAEILKTEAPQLMVALKMGIPQLMVASGDKMKAEMEIREIKNTIRELGYAIYGWDLPGKADKTPLPFILWVYGSNSKDAYYQKVPFGLLVVDRILKGKRELPDDWKEGMKWVERAYDGKTVNDYIGDHKIFLKSQNSWSVGKTYRNFRMLIRSDLLGAVT